MCDTCFEGVTMERIIMFLGSRPECRYSYQRRLPRAQKRLNVSRVIYTFSPLPCSSSNIQSSHHRSPNDRTTSRQTPGSLDRSSCARNYIIPRVMNEFPRDSFSSSRTPRNSSLSAKIFVRRPIHWEKFAL